MILLIDNYDSFTYNLYQYLGDLGADINVVRNDKITVEEIERLAPAGIVISPGPGRPENSCVSIDMLRYIKDLIVDSTRKQKTPAHSSSILANIPILGVCLGHQAIGSVWGGNIVRANQIMHGKVSEIRHDGRGIFSGVPSPFTATRYHSLIVDQKNFPEDALEITATTEDGTIMGVRHKALSNLEGVQFHPESILSEYGMKMMENFLSLSHD